MPFAIEERRRRRLLEFEESLGVEFKNLELMNQALIHSSYTKYDDPSALDNETLEYLGDAVVELVTSTYLFKHFKDASEGELTKMRASLVCQESLSRIALELGFGEMLIVGSSENNEVGRHRPSTLEDAFEAFVGALYLDRGWLKAKAFVEKNLAAGFERLKREGIFLNDAKSALQEKIQRELGHKIEYVELRNYGPDHNKTFVCAVKLDGKIRGRGKGKTKKQAEQAAARQALAKLEKIEKIERIEKIEKIEDNADD